jgi:hypothetical protein
MWDREDTYYHDKAFDYFWYVTCKQSAPDADHVSCYSRTKLHLSEKPTAEEKDDAEERWIELWKSMKPVARALIILNATNEAIEKEANASKPTRKSRVTPAPQAKHGGPNGVDTKARTPAGRSGRKTRLDSLHKMPARWRSYNKFR